MGADLRLRGLHVPVVTPFDAEGGVDTGALESLARDLIDAGAAGIVALATTGEASALDASERAEVVAACAGVCAERGATLIVGAGTNDTRATIERHETLADVPAVAASLAVVPYYVRPSEKAIVRHFTEVAARSPVPVVLYNVPYRVGRALHADALLELAAVDNIAGVKQAVGALDADTLTLLAGCPPDFAVLAGDDPYIFPVALMGGVGAIAASAHVCTARFARMLECGMTGRVEQGRAEAAALLPLVQALFAEPSPQVVKAVLHARGAIFTADVRMPLENASSEAVARALAVLEQLEP